MTKRIPRDQWKQPKPVGQRLMARVLIPKERLDECWTWTGRPNSGGYGTLRVGGVSTPAHRASYETYVGPIPAGLKVLHRCDNPPCIRPSHLFLGTRADNVADMLAKGRARHGRGEGLGQSKLREQDVRDIRRRRAEGESRRSVAAAFSITATNVDWIVSGHTWRHVA